MNATDDHEARLAYLEGVLAGVEERCKAPPQVGTPLAAHWLRGFDYGEDLNAGIYNDGLDKGEQDEQSRQEAVEQAEQDRQEAEEEHAKAVRRMKRQAKAAEKKQATSTSANGDARTP